uniref:tetratricopeptide repeat protein 39B-like n=1 Tax=Styela clava TaxID=7725 RepID=UPI0019396BAB|nr:tetratricopeptide repeat protein 39B-like [Styela clava]
MAETEYENYREEEGSDDEFADALFDLKIRPDAEDSEIQHDISEVTAALHYFLNNEFVKAKDIVGKGFGKTMYHSLGTVTVQFLEAFMTFDSKDIADTLNSTKEANSVLQKSRRKENISTTIGKALGITNTAELTEEELHSELITAECLFFRSALTFIQDENMISFIKGALKIRQCYQIYNYCHKILGKLNWKEDEMLRHFAGGVFLGCGAFNVFMSVLPPRIITLLEWVGFTCDKKLGFQQLMSAYEEDNVRSSLGALYLLTYHLFIAQITVAHDEDLEVAERILDVMLKQYPSGVYFLMFKGRLEEIKGNFTEASTWLVKSSSTQQEWKQLSHLCYWELMWCHSFKLEWEEARKYANLLRKESKWSPAIYTYLCAIFLYMQDDKSEEKQKEIDDFMRQVPDLKQRIAGKSFPMEKFVARKSRKYFEQGKRLVMPAQEMLFVWNGMAMLEGNPECNKKHLAVVHEEREKLDKLKAEQEKKDKENDSTSSKKKPDGPEFNYFDDYCLLQLFKGICMNFNGQPLQAELCFTDVRENHKGIKKDHYMTPFALIELVWMLMKQQRYDEARATIKSVKQDYKHYSHESKLHFRMHSAQTRLNILTGEDNTKSKGMNSTKKSSQASLNSTTSSNGVKF